MEANRFRNLPIAAAYGDAGCFVSTVTFAATSAGEVVDFADLPAGAEIYEVKAVNAALGADTTMAFGMRYPDGDTAATPANFLAAASTATAGSRESAIHPLKLAERGIVTGTLAGATATGKVTVHVKYRFIGL